MTIILLIIMMWVTVKSLENRLIILFIFIAYIINI